MKFDARNIPLEVDVWNEIEGKLATGLKDVTSLRFDYSADRGNTIITIEVSGSPEAVTEVIELDRTESDDLVMILCERFNISHYSLNGLGFNLKPGEIPNFEVRVYPFVTDYSTLDTMKSRMNPMMID